jgi:hypothetical protein
MVVLRQTARHSLFVLAVGVAIAVAALLTTPAYAGTRPVTPPAGARTQAVNPLAACQQQSFLEGQHYSAVQIAQLAKNAGFNGQGWTISVAVALAESLGWTRARLINTDCSVDRGLWQINSRWHGEVSDAQAFDPAGAARAAYAISAAGTNWTPWVTFTNGAYQAHMAEAQAAVNQVGGGGGGGGGGSWQPDHAYTVGQQVTYGGRTYRCLQSHTSLPGWEPPNVPALWQAR